MCFEIFAGFRCCGEDFSLEAVVFLLLKAPTLQISVRLNSLSDFPWFFPSCYCSKQSLQAQWKFTLALSLSRTHQKISYCLPYNSHDVSSLNLVLGQLIIPLMIFFFILITCLLDIRWKLWGALCIEHLTVNIIIFLRSWQNVFL